jgi:ubiquinone/menaquinone biosynthesis C-methylase UbiE
MGTSDPIETEQFTDRFNRLYGRFAKLDDLAVRWLPVWRNWLVHVLPHIHGPRVLEVSYGTGYLLTQYAHRYRVYGIDYNAQLSRIALINLRKAGLNASLQRADVIHLPFPADCFDTLVNTMAFSAYPDGEAAMSELHRVLKPTGRLLIIDICHPDDQNRLGMLLAKFWEAAGDILRDLGELLDRFGFEYSEDEIGGSGSVHLFVATKTTGKLPSND